MHWPHEAFTWCISHLSTCLDFVLFIDDWTPILQNFESGKPFPDYCIQFCEAWASLMNEGMNRVSEQDVLTTVFPFVVRLLEYPVKATNFSSIMESLLGHYRVLVPLIGLRFSRNNYFQNFWSYPSRIFALLILRSFSRSLRKNQWVLSAFHLREHFCRILTIYLMLACSAIRFCPSGFFGNGDSRLNFLWGYFRLITWAFQHDLFISFSRFEKYSALIALRKYIKTPGSHLLKIFCERINSDNLSDFAFTLRMILMLCTSIKSDQGTLINTFRNAGIFQRFQEIAYALQYLWELDEDKVRLYLFLSETMANLIPHWVVCVDENQSPSLHQAAGNSLIQIAVSLSFPFLGQEGRISIAETSFVEKFLPRITRINEHLWTIMATYVTRTPSMQILGLLKMLNGSVNTLAHLYPNVPEVKTLQSFTLTQFQELWVLSSYSFQEASPLESTWNRIRATKRKGEEWDWLGFWLCHR